jgi:hypothetical protein
MSDGLTDAYKVMIPKRIKGFKRWDTIATKLEEFFCIRKSNGTGKQCH